MRPPRRHQPRRLRLLHHVAVLVGLGTLDRPAQTDTPSERRHHQRLALVRRLLHPLPAGLASPEEGSDRFWRILRWGGAGFLLAWWLGGR